MTPSYSSLKEKLPASTARRITEICGDFEDAWKRGERPQIESYLKDVAGPERTVLFCELLLLELEYRQKNDETPDIAEYQDRFPEEKRLGEIFDTARTKSESASQDSAAGPESTLHTLPKGNDSLADAAPSLMIEDYEILDGGKRGGMGTVYKGRNPRTEAFVAIKVPHPHTLGEEESRTRFLNEARNAAKLEHANICRIYDVKDDRDPPFIVMEYIDGPNLAEWVKEKPRTAAECAGVVAKVARAVHFAHERHIIHRDIKPQNILVRQESGQPVLTDFGLAKNLVPGGPELTHTLQILGTPAYMAPEQTAGAKKAGPLSDVYALGAVLYFLLCKEPPFKFAKDDDILDRLNIVKTKEPSPLRDKVRSIPKELEGICNKAMAKNAAERFPTAKDLAESLEKFCRPTGISTRRILTFAGIAGAVLLLIYLSVMLSNLATQKRYSEEEPANHRRSIINTGGVKFMRLSKNEDLLLAVGLDSTLRLWDFIARKELKTWKTPIAGTDFLSVALSPDGWSAFVIVGEDLRKTFLKKVNLRTGKYEDVKGNRLQQPFCVQYRPPHGREILVGGNIGSGWSRGPFYLVDANDLAKGYQIGKDNALLAQAQQLVFSSDGAKFLSSIANGSVYLWNAVDGKILTKAPDGDPGHPRVVALSPDAKWALTSCRETTAFLWNLESPEQNKLAKKTATLTGHESAITTMAFSPDGKYAATGSADATVRVWHVNSAKQIAVFTRHKDTVTSVLFTDKGKTILSASRDGRILSWRWQTKVKNNEVEQNPAPVKIGWPDSLPGHKKAIISLSASKDGRRLLSAGIYDSTLRLWDVENGKMLKELTPKESGFTGILSASLSPGGAAAFVTAQIKDKALSLWRWNCDTGKIDGPILDRFTNAGAVCYSPNEREVFVGVMPNGPVTRINAKTLAKIGDIGMGRRALMTISLDVSADGARLLASNQSGAHLWETSAGKLIWKHEKIPSVAALSPNGKTGIFCWDSNDAQVWDLENNKHLRDLIGQVKRIQSIDFSPDGRLAATCGGDKTVRIWDVASGKQLHVFKGHKDNVTRVLFLPDGKRIVSGGNDGSIRLWALPDNIAPEKNSKEVVLPAHQGEIVSLSISQNGTRLLSAGKDLILRLLELPGGKPVKIYSVTKLNELASGIRSAAISPDAKRAILTLGPDPAGLYQLELSAGKLDRVRGIPTYVRHAAYLPHDGRTILVSRANRGPFLLFDANNLKEMRKILDDKDGSYGNGTHLAIGSKGMRFLAEGTDGVYLWDIPSGKVVTSIRDNKFSLTKRVFALSPNAKQALLSYQSADVQLHDLDTNKELLKFKGHTDNVLCVAFSSDGRFVATGSRDKTIRIWDVNTGKQLHVFRGHKDGVTCVLFGPNSNRILSGCKDGTIRLWTLPAKISFDLGLPAGGVRNLKGHTQRFYRADFSPEQDLLLWKADGSGKRRYPYRTGISRAGRI